MDVIVVPSEDTVLGVELVEVRLSSVRVDSWLPVMVAVEVVQSLEPAVKMDSVPA